MFFGASKNKKGKTESVLDKYNPWYAEQYSGELEYKLDNNNKYRIFREFRRSKCKIIDENMNDISKEFSIDKNKGNMFFYEQTNIDEDSLLSTAISRQEEIKLDEKEQKNLTARLTNLAQTGEENISYIKAIDKLEKKLKDEIGTERTIGKPINIIESKLLQYKNDIANSKNKKEEISQIESKIEQNKKKQIKLKDKIDLNKKIHSFKQKQKIKQELKQVKETKNLNIINIVPIVLLIMLIIIFIAVKDNITKWILIGLDFTFLIVYSLNILKNKKKDKEKLKEEEEKVKNEMDDIYQEFSSKVSYTNEIDNLFSCKLEEVTKIMEEEDNLYNEIILENNRLLYEKERLNSEIDQYSNLYDKLELLEKEKQQIKSLENSIRLAKQEIEKAYLQMKNKVIPSVTNTLSQFAKEITDGKYNRVSFSDEKGLIVCMENGDICEIDKLSVGTTYQLYLALRIALINEMSNSDESVPIIMDEAFSYFDDKRLKSTLKFLNNISNNNQVIVFTCNSKEENILNEIGINYNLIKLG